MNKLVKNTSIYTIGNILPKIITFILIPIYTNFLSVEEYGIVNSMTLLQSIIIIFMTLGLERSIYRIYHDYNKKDKNKFLGNITIALVINSFIIALLCIYPLKNILNLAFSSISFKPYYYYMIVGTFLSVFSLVPMIYYQVTNNPKKFIITNIIIFLTDTILRLYFIVILKKGAEGQLLAMVIANLIFVPYFIYQYVKNYTFMLDIKMILEALKFSLPMIPALMSAWIINLSDRIFIDRFLTMGDVGIYSFAYKIGEVVIIFAVSFITAYNPIFYSIANNENERTAKKKLSKYNTIYAIIISILCFVIAYFSIEITIILCPKEYFDAIKIIPIICYSYAINSIVSLNTLSFYQQKKTTQVMILNIISAFVNIILNYILIKQFGAIGAAIATLVTFTILLLVTYKFSKKYFFVKIHWKLLVIINLISMVLVILNFILFYISIKLYVIYKIIIVISFCIIIIKNIKDIKSIFTKLIGGKI